MLDISIAIVTYNNENIIENTLNSLVKSLEYKLDYVIYVIDNNSTDKTLNIVKSLKGNIVIIENKRNVGFGTGHNKVIEIIQSRYHIVVNPDITIVNDCIIDMFSYMEENPAIGLLTPLIKYPDGNIQYLCKRNPTVADLVIRLLLKDHFKNRQNYYVRMETGYNRPFTVDYSSGCFMFFRTEIFKGIGGFDENFFMYLEDADITRRVNEVSKTVFYPYNFVVHEWQRGSHKNFKLMWINIKSAFYYFKKWGLKLY